MLALACGDDGGSAEGDTSGNGTSTSESTAVVDASTGPDDTGAASSSSTGDDGLLDVYDLEGDELFPEGVAFDPVGQAFYVGSLSDGSVHRIDADGTQTMASAGAPGNWSTAGLKVDPAAGRIWTCSSETDDDMTQAIWVLDLASGDVLELYDLADIADGADCNDVALDADGVAYVSDPPLGTVHRIEVGGAAEAWATHDDFQMEIPGLGLNGLAVTPDAEALIVAKFLSTRLFRIALSDPTDIVEVDLAGTPFTGGTPISGADGIVFSGDALFVTFAEIVKRVDFDAGWASGTVSDIEVPGAGNGLSTAAEANGSVYVVKSEVTAFVLGEPPNLPFQILRATP